MGSARRHAQVVRFGTRISTACPAAVPMNPCAQMVRPCLLRCVPVAKKSTLHLRWRLQVPGGTLIAGHMRTENPCKRGYEVVDDNKCVQSCNSGQVLNTESGECEECGGENQLICSDSKLPSAVLCACRTCVNVVLHAMVLARP